MRARTLTALVVAVGVFVAPAAARAHAVLTHSTPHADATVQSAPPRVVLDFNEPVGAGAGSVRVYNEKGERVDRGDIVRPRERSAGVALPRSLGRGVYTVTYRVVSADGHPVSGGVAFGVLTAVRVGRSGPSVAQLLADQNPSKAVEATYGAARGIHYLALLVVIGVIPFWLFVWRAGAGAGLWPRSLLIAAVAVGFAASVIGLFMQGLLAEGGSLGDVLRSGVVRDALESDTGTAWLVRAATWAVTAIVVLPRATWTREHIAWLAVAAAVLVGSFPFGGHATTQTPEGVLVAADLVHIVAAGAWLGGLVLLVAAFWPRGRGVARQEAWLASGSFSRGAVWAIAAVVLAGSAQAWFYLGSLDAFVDGAYGIALLVKIGLVAVIVALGALNRRRLVDKGERTARSLRNAMRTEIALALAILAATAVLVREAPPQAVARGPQQKELNLGPMRLEMVVEPAQVGRNAFHFYFFNRRTGAQVSQIAELTLTMAQPKAGIAPIKLKIPRKGPAHYELLGQSVPVKGDWETTITARVSEFDEYEVKTSLRFRGR